MPSQSDICPLNTETGNHRYFIFKTYDTYEPIEFNLDASDPNVGAITSYLNMLPKLYGRIEYAVLGCNCGSVIKRKVEQ